MLEIDVLFLSFVQLPFSDRRRPKEAYYYYDYYLLQQRRAPDSNLVFNGRRSKGTLLVALTNQDISYVINRKEKIVRFFLSLKT